MLAALCGASACAPPHTSAPLAPHRFFADGPTPLVIAHRGGMGQGPENTLFTFRRAVRAGADVLEMDLRVTADGAFAVLHDATVDRTTDGRGLARELSMAALASLDAGHRWTADGGATHPFRRRGIAVPSLQEVLATLPSVRMNLELKDDRPDLAQPLCARIRATESQTRVLVASFHDAVVDAFRRACPEVATAATAAEARRFAAASRLWLAGRLRPRAPALQVPARIGPLALVTRGFIGDAHRLGLRVHAWTVNDRETLERLLDAGVDGIMTDHPGRLRALLARRGDAGSSRP